MFKPAAPQFRSGYGGIGRRNAAFAHIADHRVIATARTNASAVERVPLKLTVCSATLRGATM